MKKIKYMLFAFLVSFIYLSNAKAISCEYKIDGTGIDAKYICNITENNVVCNLDAKENSYIIDTNKTVNITSNNYFNSSENTYKCSLNNIYAKYKITEDNGKSVTKITELHASKATCGSDCYVLKALNNNTVCQQSDKVDRRYYYFISYFDPFQRLFPRR